MQTNLQQYAKKNFITTSKTIYKQTNTENGKLVYNYLFRNITTMGILSGGAALIISKNQILCKAKTSRMVGYRSISDRNLKFDWKRFWCYLKPYIGYFIAAIWVSRFFLNSV